VSTIPWRVPLADHFESNWDAKTLSPRTCSHPRLSRNCRRLSRRRAWVPFECWLSQIARQSLPHRPTHLNWFEQSSMTPPHSGQMQFTMADRTFSIGRFDLSSHIQLLPSTEVHGFRCESLGAKPPARSHLLAIAVATVPPHVFAGYPSPSLL